MGLFGAMSSFLSGPVGNNLKNAPQDVRTIKRSLNRLGYFDDETENDFVTRELDHGIKNFQKDNNLRVDGTLLPGGETERKIGDRTRERLSSPDAEFDETFEDEEFEDDPDSEEDFEEALPDEEDREGSGDEEWQKEKEDSPAAGSFGQPAQNVDATGRMIRDDMPPVPEKKPVVPETARPGFDLDKAPVFNSGKVRREILLNNDPAKFEIEDNPRLENPSFQERFKQTIVKDEDFGNEVVRNHEKTIEKMAQKHGVDPDLVKSVMWAENARGHWFGTNDFLDDIHRSKTQTPMNINGRMWARLVDKPGQRLDNEQENIEAGVILLKRIADRIEDPTPEKIGSIWNAAGRENVNEMGKEIGKAYRNKPWARKK